MLVVVPTLLTRRSGAPVAYRTDLPGPSFEAGWQRIVDMRAGEVEEVPDAAAPGTADRSTHPTTNARGETVTVETGDRSVEVVLTTQAGSRTLLAVEDIPEGGYAVGAAFGAPSGWIALDDGRVLVVVPDAAEEIRVLTDATEMRRFDPELARFAITDQDLAGTAR